MCVLKIHINSFFFEKKKNQKLKKLVKYFQFTKK